MSLRPKNALYNLLGEHGGNAEKGLEGGGGYLNFACLKMSSIPAKTDKKRKKKNPRTGRPSSTGVDSRGKTHQTLQNQKKCLGDPGEPMVWGWILLWGTSPWSEQSPGYGQGVLINSGHPKKKMDPQPKMLVCQDRE